ncbi:MAG: DUF2793 domain-containing protein [Rhodobacteraceae bacterium]|nr:DUF2793 domain-containing protein [Paracoccaceae bacterium]
MAQDSPNLELPYIQPSQAQKHVTHNEAIRRLDALVHLAVLSATRANPLPAPQNGHRFILPAAPKGVWANRAQHLAVFEENTWVFIMPKAGWVAWVADTGKSIVFDGTSWTRLSLDLQNLDHLGIKTTADANHPLAVAATATLLTHNGTGGHQLKLNKATSTDRAALLFQTNKSTRAEIGTTAADHLAVKIRSDGGNFRTALQVEPESGRLSFPAGVHLPDFGISPLVNTAYIEALGTDLVPNGTGALGNTYGFSEKLTRDPATTPDLPAAFFYSGYRPGSWLPLSKPIPVDPNLTYTLASYVRQEKLQGDWSTYKNAERQAHSMGLLCLDADRKPISGLHSARYYHAGIDSLTTLAAPLAPGDKVVYLRNAQGWNERDNAYYNRGMIIFGYRSSEGRHHSYYSRIVQHALFEHRQVDKSNHRVTLSVPLPERLGNPYAESKVWPAGTAIANTANPGPEQRSFYAHFVPPATEQWYRTENHIGGVDHSGQNQTHNFPPGTIYIRVIWRPNESNVSGGRTLYPDTGAHHRVWCAGLSIKPNSLAIQSRNDKGAVALRVPAPNADNNALVLAAATFRFHPV